MLRSVLKMGTVALVVFAGVTFLVGCMTAPPSREVGLLGRWGQVEGIPIAEFLPDGNLVLMGSPFFMWEGDGGKGKYWMQSPLAPAKIDFVYELQEGGTRLYIHFKTPGSAPMDLYKLP